jgi:4'-phosphopantetheinyl transferase
MNQYVINQNEVHVWSYLLDAENPDMDFFYNLLTEDEKTEINKIKIRKVRNQKVISKAIVKNILSKYLGVTINQIKFSYNKFGKPVLPADINLQDLNFNVSHSGELGIIALTKKYKIGVDVERIAELADIDDIIQMCFSKDEQRLFHGVKDPEKTTLFYRIWTGKEAFVKAIGKGFSFPLKNISFKLNHNKEIVISDIIEVPENLNDWQIYNFNPQENYSSAVVVNLNSFLIRKFEWNQAEILN